MTGGRRALLARPGTATNENFDSGQQAFNVLHATAPAQGDGRTDDASAFDHWLGSAAALGGHRVLVPPGRYVIGHTLELGSGVTLEGVGANSVLVAADSLVGPLLRVPDGTTNAGISQLVLETGANVPIEVGTGTSGLWAGASGEIDVMALGAVGDDVHDDAHAFEAALALADSALSVAPENGSLARVALGRAIRVPTPPVGYYLSRTIVLPKGKLVSFLGMGAPQSVHIRCTDASGYAFRVEGTESETAGEVQRPTLFQNLFFDGAGIEYGEDVRRYAVVRDCFFLGTTVPAVLVGTGSVNLRIEDCFWSGCAGGVWLLGATTTDETVLERFSMVRGTDVDIRIENTGDVLIKDGDLETRHLAFSHKPFIQLLGGGMRVENVRLGNEENDERRNFTDFAMTSASAVLTSASAPFRAWMATAHARVNVLGAGASGATIESTVSAYTSATQVTLAVAAGTTVADVQGAIFYSVTDAAITASDTTLTSATGPFEAGMVGQYVVVPRAGEADDTTTAFYGTGGRHLVAKIASYTSATSVELDTAADHTVTGASCRIYPPNTQPLGPPREPIVVGPLVTDSPNSSDTALIGATLDGLKLVADSASASIDRQRTLIEFRAPINSWQVQGLRLSGEAFQYDFDDWYSGVGLMDNQGNNTLGGIQFYRDRKTPTFRNGGGLFSKGFQGDRAWLADGAPERGTRNLLKDTHSLATARWAATGCAVTLAGDGPDGVTDSASTLTKSTSGAPPVYTSASVGQVGLVAGSTGVVTASVWLKAGTLNRARLGIRQTSGTARWLTPYTQSIPLETGRWVRHWITATGVPAGATLACYVLVGADADATVGGSILCWGPQLEEGAGPTAFQANPANATRLARPLGAVQHGPVMLGYGTAAPTADYHVAGDLWRNTAALRAGDVWGWQCVTSGAPGTWVTAGVLGGVDGTAGLHLFDEFASGNTGTGAIGALGWLFTAVGTGAISYVAPEAGHPGIMRLTTGATAGSSLALYLRQTPASGVLLPADLFDVSFVAKVAQANSDADAIYRLGLGLNPATVPPDTSGLYVERLGGEANWWAVRRTAGVDARTDTTVVQAASTWRRHRIQRINASTVRFTVGTTSVDCTTGIPTGSVSPVVQIGNGAAAAAKTLDIDLFSLQVGGLSR